MNFFDFFSSLLGGKRTPDPRRINYSIGGLACCPAEVRVEMQRIALHICKDYIASAAAKCEWRTFLRGKEVFGDEYYLWNIKPNPNQTSTQFWQEAVYRLYDEAECLIVPVGNQIMIAEGFTVEKREVVPSIYSGISRGTLMLDRVYTSDEVMHLTLPKDVIPAWLLSGVTGILNSTLSEAVEKYRLEGGDKGVLELDAMRQGDEEDDNKLKESYMRTFKDFYGSKSSVLPLLNGEKYTAITNSGQQKNSIVSDITALLTESISIVAEAMKIPPALILGTVADTKTAVDNFLTFCIDPLTDMITEAINACRYGKEVLKGSYIACDTSCIKHIDGLTIAGDLDKLKAASLFNTNELRRKINEPAINEEWAYKYTLTKNYETVAESGGQTGG